MTEPTIDWDALRAAAEASLPNAHAPYSKLRVAAALLDSDGRIHCGVNVENASYGLSLCAERSAVAAAVGAGARRFRALALISSAPTPLTPCGACRQVLVEFPPGFELRTYGTEGGEQHFRSDDLLPARFTL